MGRKKKPKLEPTALETSIPPSSTPPIVTQVPPSTPIPLNVHKIPTDPRQRATDPRRGPPPAAHPALIPPQLSEPNRLHNINIEDDRPTSLGYVQNEAPPAMTAGGSLVKVEEPAEDKKSGYSMTSHSGDLIEEDIYVSDGSDDDEKEEMEFLLTGSRMGLMRRGLGTQMFQAKEWVRSDTTKKEESPEGEEGNEENHDDGEGSEEELDESMDPAERAALLLAAKQRKLEEAKVLKRQIESAENAGRDPCLFSKRTAFDIRMDQIEDKPWERSTGGTGDATDYFNYGLSELDWMDYSQGQLTVRQELTDASRQKRQADPTIVKVTPKAPARQQPKVAVANVDKKTDTEIKGVVVVGPTLPSKESNSTPVKVEQEGGDESMADSLDAKEKDNKSESSGTSGGAWGAGAPPGSILAKLIEEQERNDGKPPPPPPPPPNLPPPPPPFTDDGSSSQSQGDSRHSGKNKYHSSSNTQQGHSSRYNDHGKYNRNDNFQHSDQYNQQGFNSGGYQNQYNHGYQNQYQHGGDGGGGGSHQAHGGYQGGRVGYNQQQGQYHRGNNHYGNGQQQQRSFHQGSGYNNRGNRPQQNWQNGGGGYNNRQQSQGRR